MEVTENLFNWLQKSNVLKHPPSQISSKLHLSEEDAQAFENGLRFVPLIRRVLRSTTRAQTPVPEINSLKDTNSTAAKLYNWNILIRALEIIHISVDSDMKALIIAGDRAIVADILKSIYEADQVKADSDELKKKKRKFLGEGALLLNDLDPASPLSSSENTLEFLILSLCKSFSLNSKTAAGLLMQSGKFLTQVLQKGLKGKSQPVIRWYEMIIENTALLGERIEKEKSSANFVLGSLKGGIVSKDFEVVQKTCEAMVCVCKSCEIETWTWFSTEVYPKAFAAYDSFKEDVTTYILNLIITLGKNNLKEAFGQMIVDLYPEPSVSFSVISSFWGYINEDSQAYQDIQNQGLVNYWIEFGLRETENHQNMNSKVSALGFLCDVWLKYDKFIGQHEDLANCILTVLKRACREKSKILRVICFGRLFLLLSIFSKKKNSYAAIIFKTLTFALVENYSIDRIREFLLYNFIIILEEIQNLPVNILIEPFVKQSQNNPKRNYNTADFDFYVSLARHPRLLIQEAVILADNLGKIYFNDIIYSSSAEIPLVLIFGRFIDSKPMQEFISKLLELGLKLIYSKLKQKPRVFVKESLTKEEQEEEKSLNSFKRLFCILSEKIINLGNFEINNEIKEILILGCVEIKKITGGGIKGLKIVLDLLGDSTSLIDRYEIDRGAIVAISESGSRASSRVVSISNSSSKRPMALSRPRERALSDIERVKQLRKTKENQEKSEIERKQQEVERQKKILRSHLEQRKILLCDSSEALVVKELNTVIEMPFYSIDEETKQDQDLIYISLRKFTRVFKALFHHYASSGYKIEKFPVKPTFESILDKRASISEGEMIKLLREHSITNSLITTEEIRKIIAWMLQKMKLKYLEFDSFSLLLFYISQFIYTKSPFEYNQFPSVVCMLALIDQFQRSPAKIVPLSCFTEPDYGVGDKDVLRSLNDRIKKEPLLELPECYKKVQEKDIKVSYFVPPEFPVKESYKMSLELLDSLLYKSFAFHLLSPIVSVSTITIVKGFLNRPQIESEDKKLKDLGIPSNKASYKAQPLPAYMNFTPGIKIELSKLSGKYPNDLLMECARLTDDLLFTIDSKSFEIISRNPRPAGSISNKITQQKLIEEAALAAEKDKSEVKRKLRTQALEQDLIRMRSEKQKKQEEDEIKTLEEKQKEELEKRLKQERRVREKEEIEKRIKEFKLRKEEDELSKLNQEREVSKITEEKKRKEREEFLKQAKIKLINDMNKKKEKKEGPDLEVKKDMRKTLMKNLTSNRTNGVIEKLQKPDPGRALADENVRQILSVYQKSLESTFTYFCKLFPVSPSDTSALSLPGYSKLVSSLKIVPGLSTVDESVRIYKGVFKNKSGEPGINFAEFKEVLIALSLNSKSSLEKKANKKIETYSQHLSELFTFIDFSPDPKKTLALIRGIKS